MLSKFNPSYSLNMEEKVMLQAFIRGTKTVEGDNPNNLWTPQVSEELQDILSGQIDSVSNETLQELFCIFTDLVMKQDAHKANVDFTKIMVKFMHHLVYLTDWTTVKKVRGKPGPKPMTKTVIPILPKDMEEAAKQETNNL